MSPADRIRLQHLVDAADAAARFSAGRTRSDLDHDEMLLFALVRAVEIVGEAASKVTDEARTAIPLPWPAIVGMRNRLIHAYFDVDRDILWTTVQQSLPELRRVVKVALDKAFES
jgi:uncharacterized protein with HEPN domain